MRRKRVEVGTVPCVSCRKPHYRYQTDPKMAGSWADPVDGHPYLRMSAEQVMAYVREAVFGT